MDDKTTIFFRLEGKVKRGGRGGGGGWEYDLQWHSCILYKKKIIMRDVSCVEINELMIQWCFFYSYVISPSLLVSFLDKQQQKTKMERERVT